MKAWSAKTLGYENHLSNDDMKNQLFIHQHTNYQYSILILFVIKDTVSYIFCLFNLHSIFLRRISLFYQWTQL